jgi:uncharacterized protein (TIGR03000 family)
MRRSWLVGGGALTLAATALFLLPSVSLAQRRGGRGGGWNGDDRGWSGNDWGGRGWGDGYGWSVGIDGVGFGYGRGGWGYPGYGGYGYGNGWYSPYGYANSGWYSPYVYDYDYGPNYGYDTGDYYYPSGQQGYYGGDYATNQGNMNQGMANQNPNAAHILLRVPGNAQVFFEGQPTTERGSVRAYVSPPLEPNKEYTYDVRAQWTQNGQQRNETRHVRVRAGARVQVDFMRPQGAQGAYGAGQAMPGEELGQPFDRNMQDQPGHLGQPDRGAGQNRLNQGTGTGNGPGANNPRSPTGNQNTPGADNVPPASTPNQNRNPSNP